jgi:alkanesulfonate monooxygenase SsuD/methylene tetrahydromethanopterin reductase-like flavin-dependent oxidoreductase (luciferase family)
MSDKPFQFAIVAMPEDGKQWRGLARRAEELGYTALLMPDGLRAPSPFPALALAAGAATTLRVGTWVAASPLRPPRLAAWDAHTLSTLSGGRFDFGIGTGRPDVADDAVKLLGQPELSPAGRLAQVEQTIDELRALDADAHTPVTMAAGGPKARALAAAKADRIALAAGPFAGREEVAALIAQVRERAGDRGDQLEFAAPIFVVGDDEGPLARRFLQTDAKTLIERDSLMILHGTAAEMAGELRRRRETLGISYLAVSGFFTEEFAPVVELLAGR